MKKGFKIGAMSLAALLVFGAAGCSVSDKDGKAWAEKNGYVKYESSDTFTSASVTEESSYKVVSGQADDVIAAMNKYKGTFLHATINEDGSVDVGYFIYALKKASDGSYYIEQGFGANADGSVNQTIKNLERTKKGTAYFISHSFGEMVGTTTYTAVTGASAPTWAANTYYSRTGTEGNYTYTLVAAEPADWATTYTNYYTGELTYNKVNWSSENTPVVGAKMYYNVDKIDYNGKVTSVKATLKVYKIDPIV